MMLAGRPFLVAVALVATSPRSATASPTDAVGWVSTPDVPLAANEVPHPGALFLEMGGVAMKDFCNNGFHDHAAKNCSTLLADDVNIPAYGDSQQRQALVQSTLANVGAFDVAVHDQRPPEYLPYFMAVVGGSAPGAGFDGNTCGIARVSCGAQARQLVSFNFPTTCGSVAETVAQEIGHNFGLEHVDDSTDHLYPSIIGAQKSYTDRCNRLSEPNLQCGYYHEDFCPTGEQNSYQELLNAFGPRATDDEAPEITEIHPPDGAVMNTTDSFAVSAVVSENSNYVGVRWTWTAGAPEELGDGFTRCTNAMCDEDYPLFVDPNEHDWPFIQMQGPPVGTYSFTFEVTDAYGNTSAESITFDVVAEGGSTGGSGGSDSGDDSGGTGGGGDDSTGGESDGTDGGGSATGLTGLTTGTGDELGDDGSCACTTGSTTPVGASPLLLLLVGRRRRYWSEPRGLTRRAPTADTWSRDARDHRSDS